ncbi:uncharacterized protein tud isoform X2 [Periplaneta americana]|uniref:uncharacterized protein tud isoform X2 n=1 Tax=Periplaneta americana TaxID=6978 RepID=UPI0037E709DF
MSISQQPVEVFVTYIENDGPLLRIWGQLERTQAIFVERLILQLTEQFERGLGIPSSVEVGQLCCARYSDGVYYRARITSPADVTGQVAVRFIDYGNSEVVSVRDIRSLEESLLSPLASVTDQATEFFLAGVIPLEGAWNENNLSFIRQTICYEELKCFIAGQVANKRLLRVFYNNEDFALTLIAKKIAVTISIHAQQILLQGYYGLSTVPPQFPGFSVPPPRLLLNPLQSHTMPLPPIPSLKMENSSQQSVGNVLAVRETVRVFTSPMLEIHSEHMVYVSYVEDGPSSFAIQLQAAEGTLSSIMNEINNPPPTPLTQPLMPGSVCLGRFSEDQTLCRAVVMAVLDDKCRLYYVDFGNSEVIPHSEIFELPQKFINPKVMALRFTLSGLKTLNITNDLKSYFKELVTEKLLRLRVVPPEGPPLKQYGELYLNNANVLDLLVQKLKEKQTVQLSYSDLPLPQIGSNDNVKVSYVVNASHFYVQLEFNAEALNSVMLAVEAVCSGTATSLDGSQLRVGLPCCAQYKEDEKWYRAKILSSSSGLVEVMYVDYGNTDSVPLSCLQRIDPNLVQILKTQALPCCLSGFQENTDDDLGVRFEEMTLEKTLTMVVVDKLQNDRLLVELYDASSGSHVNIGTQLLRSSIPVPVTVEIQTDVEKTPIEDAYNVDEWQESPAGIASGTAEAHEGNQYDRKPQAWGGDRDKDRFNRGPRIQPQYRGPLSSLKGLSWRYSHGKPRDDENQNEYRSRKDDRDGGGKPWHNKDNNWRQGSGDKSVGGKWGSRGDGDKARSGKWNSRGEDEKSGGGKWNSRGDDDRTGGGKWNSRGDDEKPEGGKWNSRGDDDRTGGGKWNSRREDEKSGGGKWNSRGDDDRTGGGKWNSRREDEKSGGGKWNSRGDDDRTGGGKWNSRGDDEKPEGGKWNSRLDDDRTGGGKWNSRGEDEKPGGGKWNSRGDERSGGGKWNSRGEDDKAGVGKWNSRGDDDRIGNGKWNSRGEDERKGKHWQDNSSGGGTGYDGGEFKKKPWNRGEDTGSRGGGNRWNSDDGGGRRKKWNENEDTGGKRNRWQDENDDSHKGGDGSNKWNSNRNEDTFTGSNKWRDDNDDSRKGGDGNNKWKSNRNEDTFTGPRGYKPRADREQSGRGDSYQKNHQYKDNKSNNTWEGTEEEWNSGDEQKEIQSSIPEAALRVGDTKIIQLVFLTSPEEFCVQVTSEIPNLDTIMERIAATYGDGGGNPLPNTSCKSGVPCVARYSEDSTVYRAVIESVDGNSAVVMFCDYGNKEVVPLDEIKEISSEFLSLPVQGIRCKLLGAKPKEGVSWSEEEILHFTAVTEDKKLEACFKSKRNGIYDVVLIDTEAGININEQLGATLEQIEADISSTGNKFHTQASVGDENRELAKPDQKYVIQDITPETCDDVTITWFISPEEFYCQSLGSKSALTAMINSIQSAYCNKASVISSVQVGSPVIAKFLTDGVLYRAEVKDIPDSSSLVVQFVDYGNCDLISRTNVWDMEKRFMTLPKQAILCSLRGVKPAETAWSRGPTALDKYFEADKFQCTFHDSKDGKYNVTLISAQGRSVSDDLAGDGLAVIQTDEHVVTTESAYNDEEPIELDLLPGQRLVVHVTYVEGIAKFFVQLNPLLANNIQALIAHHVEEPENMQPIGSDSLAVDSLCITTPDSAVWYRGKILDCTRTTGVSIKFIDFGDGDEIPLDKPCYVSQVLAIPPSLAQYTAQAIECCLMGSSNNTVPPEVEDKFKEEFEDTDVILNVHSVESEKLYVAVFNMEGRKIELLKDICTESPDELEPVCPFPVISRTTKVWVSHIDSPDSIWLQKVSGSDALAEFLEKMYTFYECEGNSTELEASGNELCAAKSVADGQWYRGKITSVNSEERTCTVLFIDYGNSEIIPLENVRMLDTSHFLPHAQAICTSLTVLYDNKEEVSSHLLEIASDKAFTAMFALKKDKWLIDLFDKETSVSKQLVELGLAREYDNHLFPYKTSIVSPELSKEGISYSAIVSHIDTPCHFWIQKADDHNAIITLQDELQNIATVSETMTSVPAIGSKCMGLFFDVWYRAVVIESESSLVTVRFIDYGNIESIEISSEGLKSLPDRLKNIPEYAKLCTLSKIKTLTFNDEAAEHMESLVTELEQPITAHIMNIGDVTHIDLRLSDGSSVLDILVNEGFITDSSEVAAEDDSTVFVSHVNSPSEFWIQYKCNTNEIEEMETRMLEAVNFPLLESFSVGSLCAALFSDGQWYRAKILKKTDEECHVLYVDYGNSSDSTELRSLPEDLINIPPLAKSCSLPMPFEIVEWPAEAQSKFVEKVAGGCTEFQVKILKEGDCALVSLLENGKKVEEELSECVQVAQIPTTSVIASKFNGFVSYVTSPSEFWIQLEDMSALNEVSERLVEADEFEKVDNIEENSLYAAEFPDDGNWYRAQVLSHKEAGTEVMYVDFGNTAVSTEFRKLPHDLQNIPPLAMKCSLSIPNDIPEWPEVVNESFVEMTGDSTKLFEIEILKHSIPVLVSMKDSGKKIEDELLKMLVTDKPRDDLKDICDNADEKDKENGDVHNDEGNNVYMSDEEELSENNVNIENVNDNIVKEIGVKETERQDVFPSEGSTCSVFVSHIDTPCRFWIQKADDHNAIITLQDELQNIATVSETMTSVPAIGSKCMALCLDTWYRAVVIERESSLVTVLFIDYGNIESIEISSEGLKSLPDRLKNIPEYAKLCTLSKIKTLTFEDDATEFMESLVTELEQPIMAHIVNIGDVTHIDLRSSDGVSILDVLCNEGLVTDSNEIAAEDDSTVFVSHVNSPSEFWIQYKCDRNQIEEMETRMLEAVNFPLLESLSVGSLCAALFSDGQWYRAKILKKTDEECHVLYVDYGNSSDSTELRSLPEDLINIPPLAKSCSLSMPFEIVAEWPAEAQSKFVEKVAGGCTEFQVNILKEGDCALVSLLENGKKVEEELLECVQVAQIPTTSVIASKFNGFVSYVTSPSEFWIQLEDMSALNEVSERLVEADEFEKVDNIEENSLYAAEFPDDGNWYRAQMLRHKEAGTEVMYVDFGNTAVSTEFRKLPHDLQNIPPLAMKCSLSIPNDIPEWPEVVNESFVEMTGDSTKLFEIEILKHSTPVLVSMKDSGKKIEDELLKMLVTDKPRDDLKDICDDADEKDKENGDVHNDEGNNLYMSDEEELPENNAKMENVTDNSVKEADVKEIKEQDVHVEERLEEIIEDVTVNEMICNDSQIEAECKEMVDTIKGVVENKEGELTNESELTTAIISDSKGNVPSDSAHTLEDIDKGTISPENVEEKPLEQVPLKTEHSVKESDVKEIEAQVMHVEEILEEETKDITVNEVICEDSKIEAECKEMVVTVKGVVENNEEQLTNKCELTTAVISDSKENVPSDSAHTPEVIDKGTISPENVEEKHSEQVPHKTEHSVKESDVKEIEEQVMHVAERLEEETKDITVNEIICEDSQIDGECKEIVTEKGVVENNEQLTNKCELTTAVINDSKENMLSDSAHTAEDIDKGTISPENVEEKPLEQVPHKTEHSVKESDVKEIEQQDMRIEERSEEETEDITVNEIIHEDSQVEAECKEMIDTVKRVVENNEGEITKKCERTTALISDSKEDIPSRSVNTPEVIDRDTISPENVKEKSSEQVPHKTEHTEKLVREISVHMQTPSSEFKGKSVVSPKHLNIETVVPDNINETQSEEESSHSGRNVSDIPQRHLQNIDQSGRVQSAPCTPEVSRSDKILRRMLSQQELGQRVKLTHNDRIVPGSISRGESGEEIVPDGVSAPDLVSGKD